VAPIIEKVFREGQRVEELALLSGERKDRQEGQD
jgi:hypothetical protein